MPILPWPITIAQAKHIDALAAGTGRAGSAAYSRLLTALTGRPIDDSLQLTRAEYHKLVPRLHERVTS